MSFRDPKILRAEFTDYIVKTPYVPKQPKGRRIVTFNVHFWHDYNFVFAYDKILSVIRETCADVILFQEICAHTGEDIGRVIEDLFSLGFRHYVMSDMLSCHSKYGPFGNAVFSRYPLINGTTYFFETQCPAELIPARFDPVQDLAFRNTVFATVVFPEGRLDVYSAHLDVFDETLEVRTNQFQELFDLANARTNNTKSRGAIVCGDMNNSLEEFSKNVASAPGKFQLATPEEITVWTMKTVDYGFVHGATVNQSFVIPTGVSDHFPVVMDVTL